MANIIDIILFETEWKFGGHVHFQINGYRLISGCYVSPEFPAN